MSGVASVVTNPNFTLIPSLVRASSSSIPVMFGMFQSDSTRSGGLALMAASAFIPSSASEKSWPSNPARRKVFLTIIRIAVESSTIIIFTAILQIKSLQINRQSNGLGSARNGRPGDIHFVGQLQHARPYIAQRQYVRRAAHSHRLAGHTPDDARRL